MQWGHAVVWDPAISLDALGPCWPFVYGYFFWAGYAALLSVEARPFIIRDLNSRRSSTGHPDIFQHLRWFSWRS